jgi:hypothetical protein
MIEIGRLGNRTAYSTNKVTFQDSAVGTRFLKIGNGIGCAQVTTTDCAQYCRLL